MDLISTTSTADDAGHVFVFRFAGAGAEVVTSVRIDVPDPVMAEAFAANLLADIAQRLETKRMPYAALRALATPLVETPVTAPASVATA